MTGFFASSSLPMRWRTLLALLLAVLLVHWLMLSGSARVWSVIPPSSQAMSTRTLDAPSPAPGKISPDVVSALPATPKPQSKAPDKLPNTQIKKLDANADLASALPTVTSTQAQPSPTTAELTAAQNAQGAGGAEPAAGSAPTATDDRGEPQFPPSGKFGYEVTILRGVQPQTTSGTLEWATDGKAYQLQLDVPLLFVSALRQTSVGTLSGDGLLPGRFTDKRINRSETAAHFNREGGGNITFSSNQTDAILLRGAQDRLSVLMQLTGMAAGNPARFQPGGAVTMQIVDTKIAETWLFTVEAEETIEVPAGVAKTLRLVRQARKEFDQQLEVWMAPAMGYLPVRIKLQSENGNYYDLKLRTPSIN